MLFSIATATGASHGLMVSAFSDVPNVAVSVTTAGRPALLAGLQCLQGGFESVEPGCLVQRSEVQVAATRIGSENAGGVRAVAYG